MEDQEEGGSSLGHMLADGAGLVGVEVGDAGEAAGERRPAEVAQAAEALRGVMRRRRKAVARVEARRGAPGGQHRRLLLRPKGTVMETLPLPAATSSSSREPAAEPSAARCPAALPSFPSLVVVLLTGFLFFLGSCWAAGPNKQASILSCGGQVQEPAQAGSQQLARRPPPPVHQAAAAAGSRRRRRVPLSTGRRRRRRGPALHGRAVGPAPLHLLALGGSPTNPSGYLQSQREG